MKKTALRTPEHCFAGLPDYPYAPHYLNVSHPDYQPLRMHYLDEGELNGIPVLLLHGCPAWSYLYRKVIARLKTGSRANRLRLIAPDHIGCGKSDKLLDRQDYSYDFYVACIQSLVDHLELTGVVLVGQDWGGPIGLRVLAGQPSRFAAAVLTNTLLPNGEVPPKGVAPWPGDIIQQWVRYTRQATDLPVGQIIQGVSVTSLPDAVRAAYDAPFPDARYKQGVMNWPSLIPCEADAPGIAENRAVWQVLEQVNVPLLTAFSDQDASTADWESVFQRRARGAQGQAHTRIPRAGHMVQEDQGEMLAELIEAFIFHSHA